MADDRTVIDALSDESKAVAINELVSRIQDLTRAATSAAQNLNKVRGERAAIDNAGGLTGALARRIKDGQVSDARKESASVYSELQAARLRMVNLTGSRITNFKRGRGESEIAAVNRLGGLHAAYRAALGDANTSGALAGQDYIGKREVDATAKQFLLNPNGDRFKEKEPDRAGEIVRNYFGGKMQKLATLGGRYFSMVNPMMQKMKPFFGRGGFTPMAGLMALGPMGIAASTGIAVGKQAYNFQRRIHAGIQSLQNEALLSGLSTGTLSSYGVALGAFGGNRQGMARLSGGIAGALGGMRYGMGGGNLTAAARIFGLNLMGSGYGGLATTEEILMRMSGLMEHADDMQKEQLVFMASQLGLSADQVRLMKLGPKKIVEQIREFSYLSDRMNTPESVEAAERADRAFAEMKLSWDVAMQKWFAESGFSEFLNKVGTGFGNALNSSDGPVEALAKMSGQAMSSWGASAASIGSSVVNEIGSWFGWDLDLDMQDAVDTAAQLRKQYEEEGNGLMAGLMAAWEGLGSIFTSEGPFTHQMKEEGGVLPETVDGAGNNGGYITIEPDIKIEAQINTSADTVSGNVKELGPAIVPQLQSAIRRGTLQGLVGAEK